MYCSSYQSFSEIILDTVESPVAGAAIVELLVQNESPDAPTTPYCPTEVAVPTLYE